MVAQQNNKIIGFAYAHHQAERKAYAWNAELSVYLAPAAQKKGLGTSLYKALLKLIVLQGIKSAYGKVTLPNPASQQLHRSFGFSLMGIQRNAGYTCGGWHDVAWFILPLGTYTPCPATPVSFPRLYTRNQAAVQEIIAKAHAKKE